MTENNSKKLIIILQYKKNIPKNKPFRPLHQNILNLPLLKNDDVRNIDWNYSKNILKKFSQVTFRKSHEILDQFDKSI